MSTEESKIHKCWVVFPDGIIRTGKIVGETDSHYRVQHQTWTNADPKVSQTNHFDKEHMATIGVLRLRLSLVEIEMEVPKVITLCGSTRFYKAFQEAAFNLTMQNIIFLTVGFYAHANEEMEIVHGEGVGITPEEKERLDLLHFRKIDKSDSILVINVDYYIGKSTRNEIAYARRNGKKVEFWIPPFCEWCGGSKTLPEPLAGERECSCVEGE